MSRDASQREEPRPDAADGPQGGPARRARSLRLIAAGASTLRERLAGRYAPREGGASAELARERLDRWRKRAARDDPALFERRLSWLGLTPQEAARPLGDVSLEGELPSWARVLAESLEAAREASGERAGACRHPFGDVLAPFARTGLDMLAPACRRLFTPQTFDALRDDLLQTLSHVASPTLQHEFSLFRSEKGFAQDCRASETRLYEEFAAGLLRGGLWDFFGAYPALARLLSQTVELWARNVSELAAALESDSARLAVAFGGGGPLGRVVAVRPSLSDRHDGGRTVAVVEFEGGARLVYKPRDLGVERAWFSLLKFLNGRGGDFRTLEVLSLEGRGWVEAARHAPCRDEAEAGRFYFRAGQLLCVLYALEAYDCFCENLVACGGHPVLIDMEALMHRVPGQAAPAASTEGAAADALADSVYCVGMLPSWEVGHDGTCFDMSGLGARPGQMTPYLKRRWEHVNRDGMRLEHEPVRIQSEEHLPRLGRSPLAAADYEEQVVAGFRQAYELLVRLRGELCAPGGHVEELGRQETRVVFHASRVYSLLLKRLYAPRHMRSGVERSIELDFFSRLYLESHEKSKLRPILEAELDALERLDIPRFTAFADSRRLRLPTGETIDAAFPETALDRVRRKLSALDRADLELQVEFIRASLRASAAPVEHEARAAVGAAPWGEAEVSVLSLEQLIAEAVGVAGHIERHAIRARDGGATWIAPQLLPQSNRRVLRPLRADLYGGLAGVALFFAALERVAGTGRDVASAALSPLRNFVRTADARRLAREGYTLGAATGVGSLIYALSRCAALLQEPRLLADASAACEAITPEWIASDETFDLTGGAAGAILGLLALHGEGGAAAPLEKALLCGEHLLGRREAAGRGAAWRTGRGKLMTGFSHGAAGIALALLRLSAAAGDARFKEAAREAIAFEDSAFDEAEGNWPDSRRASGDPPTFMNTWCHGAAGIGLARMSGLAVLDSPVIRRDIEAALRAVVRSPPAGRDGLCCGDLGRAETLLAASASGGESEAGASAARLASLVVRRARQSGGYSLSGLPGRDFFDPSLFQGLSGIGYQLLRIARPQALPSVLTWE